MQWRAFPRPSGRSELLELTFPSGATGVAKRVGPFPWSAALAQLVPRALLPSPPLVEFRPEKHYQAGAAWNDYQGWAEVVAHRVDRVLGIGLKPPVLVLETDTRNRRALPKQRAAVRI